MAAVVNMIQSMDTTYTRAWLELEESLPFPYHTTWCDVEYDWLYVPTDVMNSPRKHSVGEYITGLLGSQSRPRLTPHVYM